MELPPHFVQTISATFPSGAKWLRELPALLADCVQKYDLTLAPDTFPLSFNYVVPAVRNADGREVVLKLGVPINSEIVTEIAALRLWNGTGAVRLLEADAEHGILLLERLRPGTMLSSLWDTNRDDEATEIAGQVMRGLWSNNLPAPYTPPFSSVADWANGLNDARPENTPPELLPRIAEAQSVFSEMLADTPAQNLTLLHGDLHHFNILQNGEDWRAIDPKGVWGDPAYEAGAYLRNPWPGLLSHADPQAVTKCRLTILSDGMGLDREKLRLWAWASAVLSAWWSVETNLPNGGEGWRHSAACADLLKAA